MKDILNRFKVLIIKMISIKFLLFALATVLFVLDMLDVVYWALSGLALISMRTFEKLIDKLPGGTIWK